MKQSHSSSQTAPLLMGMAAGAALGAVSVPSASWTRWWATSWSSTWRAEPSSLTAEKPSAEHSVGGFRYGFV